MLFGRPVTWFQIKTTNPFRGGSGCTSWMNAVML